MARALRAPLLHFLALGALLYAWQGLDLEDAAGRAEQDPPREIAIGADRLAELRADFVRQAGRAPDDRELRRMIAAEVEEEILFREALARGLLERDSGVKTRLLQKMLFLEGDATIEQAPALLERAIELGLHRKDIVVRRILVQKMRLLGARLAPDQSASEADVAQRYAERREALRAPDRVDLSHVFLSRDRRGEATLPDARRLLATLEAESVPPTTGPARGDAFPLGHRLARRSPRDLERSFGGDFSDAAFAAAKQARGRWSGPVASAYGAHLIFVESLLPGEVPPKETVASRLRLEIEEQRREANLEALLSDLRARYRVRTPLDPPSAPDAAQETG